MDATEKNSTNTDNDYEWKSFSEEDFQYFKNQKTPRLSFPLIQIYTDMKSWKSWRTWLFSFALIIYGHHFHDREYWLAGTAILAIYLYMFISVVSGSVFGKLSTGIISALEHSHPTSKDKLVSEAIMPDKSSVKIVLPKEISLELLNKYGRIEIMFVKGFGSGYFSALAVRRPHA